MKLKNRFKEILRKDYKSENGFELASYILESGASAQRIAAQAKAKKEENNGYATMSCDNIIEWMEEIAEEAEKALNLHLEEN